MSKYNLLRIGLYLFELIACTTGIVFWKKFKDTHWKWFIVYLTLIFILDSFGGFIDSVMRLPNTWLYNWIILPGSFLFFFWFISRSFAEPSDRKWAVVAGTIYVLCFLAGTIWLDKHSFIYFSFAYCTGNVMLLTLIILFLFRFVRGDEILQYKTNGMFWVCIGLLVYYMGSLPFFGLWNTLRVKYPDLFNNYWIVQISLDYMMYLFFAISFIWGKAK